MQVLRWLKRKQVQLSMTPYITLLAFAAPVIIYTWILSYSHLTNLREIFAALHTMSLRQVEGHNRCRYWNATHYKCLPNTFLIGASKCGTTSLVEYLSELPGVELVSRRIYPKDRHREIHRFDRRSYASNWNFWEIADEWASAPIVSDVDTVVVHYTPHYLYAPTVPMDLKNWNDKIMKQADSDQQQQQLQQSPSSASSDQMKFIVMLRDPVERALSSYWFGNSHLFGDLQDHGSTEEFEQLASAEMKQRDTYNECMRMEGHGADGLLQDDNVGVTLGEGTHRVENALEKCFGDKLRDPELGGRHIDKGVYVDQLQRWFSSFPPAFVGGSASYYLSSLEAMKDNQSSELSRLLEFLKVPASGTESGTATTKAEEKSFGAKKLKREKTLSDYRMLSKPNALTARPRLQHLADLRAFYEPYNAKLRILLYEKLGMSEDSISTRTWSKT